MGEKSGSGHDKAFESFIHTAKREASLENQESPREHAARLLSEVRQDMDAGIQAHEEAVMLLAKLAVVSEVAKSEQDPVLETEEEALRSDIRSRYPDPTD